MLFELFNMLNDFTLNRGENIEKIFSKREKIFFPEINRLSASVCKICNEVILINIIAYM